MKWLTLMAGSLSLTAGMYGQQPGTDHSIHSDHYLKKSGGRIVAAIILSSAGGLSVLTGAIIPPGHNRVNGIYYGDDDYSLKHALIAGGLGCIGTGVILFMAASRNRKKAFTVSAYPKMENFSLPVLHAFVHKEFPAFGLNIRF